MILDGAERNLVQVRVTPVWAHADLKFRFHGGVALQTFGGMKSGFKCNLQTGRPKLLKFELVRRSNRRSPRKRRKPARSALPPKYPGRLNVPMHGNFAKDTLHW